MQDEAASVNAFERRPEVKTQYYTASSLDGFIADAENSLDWLLQFGSVEQTSYSAFVEQIGAIAMGSTTYKWIIQHQVQAVDDAPKRWPYAQPTWVFTSQSLPELPDSGVRFVQGDVRPVHREMSAAAGGKNLWIVGGGDLAGQFYDHGLLDELIVQVTGVTLGRGAPLFPRRITTPPLRLQSVARFGDAFVELRYEIVR